MSIIYPRTKQAWIIIWWMVCPALLFAQATDKGVGHPIQQYIHTIVQQPVFETAAFSCRITEMATGKVVADYNGSMCIPGASTMKLVSTATALQLLGRHYRFKTDLMHSGAVDSTGTLHGDIYLVGGGDPTLGSRYFVKEGEKRLFLTQWADSLHAYGIRRVEGRVIADASIYAYDGVPPGWTWEDMGNYYGASPSGLTVFDNLCTFHFKTGAQAGSPTELTCVTPHIPHLKVINLVTSANVKRDNAYAYGAPWSYDRMVKGSIPKNKEDFKVKTSIPDPELIAAIELDYALEQRGIKVHYAPQTMRQLNREQSFVPPALHLLLRHASPTLKTIVNVTNKRSVNLFAEHLLCQLSVKQYGDGSTDKGTAICKYYWQKRIGAKGLHMKDGSGLSRSSAVSAQFLVDLLTYMHSSKNGKVFRKSMAVAGKSGTMSRMCRGTAAAGRVYGKSGTLSKVKAYAGYVDSKSGKQLAYALIVNHHNGSNAQIKKYLERVMVKMATY